MFVICTRALNRELQKDIIIRSKLRNKCLKDRSECNKKAYCKHRKTEKQYYSKLEFSKVADNKKFWKTSQIISKQLL